MAIKLTVGKPSYTLYDESCDKYVYFNGTEFRHSSVPKASGMMRSAEAMEAKRKRFTDSVEDAIQNASTIDDHYSRFECGKPGPLADVSKEQLRVIRERNAEHSRVYLTEHIKLVNKFAIVKISAEIV